MGVSQEPGDMGVSQDRLQKHLALVALVGLLLFGVRRGDDPWSIPWPPTVGLCPTAAFSPKGP